MSQADVTDDQDLLTALGQERVLYQEIPPTIEDFQGLGWEPCFGGGLRGL